MGSPRFVSTIPSVSIFWSEKNEESCDAVILGSQKDYIWECSKGHTWKTTPVRIYRAKNPCPYCDNRLAIFGENSVLDTHPHLGEMLKNQTDLSKLKKLTARSTKEFSFKCPKGHIYSKRINLAAKATERFCSVCSGSRLVKGINTLLDVYPVIAKSWDYEKNFAHFGLEGPESIGRANIKKVYWKCCECGEEDFIGIHNRVKTGCGICSSKNTPSRKIRAGVNDLKTLFPAVAEKWDYSKNPKSPEEFSSKSKEKAWFLCKECNLSEERIIFNVVKFPEACSFCSGRTLVRGFNDFATKYPELAKEWVPENRLNPEDVSIFWIQDSILWKCPKGHLWSSSIISRIKGSQCSVCFKYTSRLEVEIFNEVEKYSSNIIHKDRKALRGKELDIYFPDLSIAIEVNGDYWHSDEMIMANCAITSVVHHKKKFNLAKEVGVTLAYVWESDWKEKPDEVNEALKTFITTGVLFPILTIYSKG